MQQKIHWLSNLKTFGILSVIVGHIASPLGEFIYSWHMPLFFMLGGFFIRFELGIKEFIIKDFKRLIIPYFIFAIIGLAFEAIKRIVLHRESLNYIHELQGIFLWMDMPSLINTYGFVLWFLPSLFFGKLIIFVLNKKFTFFYIQFLIILCLFTLSFFVNIPLGIDNAFNAILFIFIGNYFFKKFYLDEQKLFILLLLLVGLLLYFGVPSLDMANKEYENVIINIAWAMSVIFIFVCFFKKMDFKSNLLTLWGENTMLLFIVHPYTNNIAHIIVEKLQFGDWYLKFFISLVLLQIILFIKQKFKNRGIFKYV